MGEGGKPAGGPSEVGPEDVKWGSAAILSLQRE